MLKKTDYLVITLNEGVTSADINSFSFSATGDPSYAEPKRSLESQFLELVKEE